MSKRNGYLPEGMDEEGGSACCIGTLSFSTLQERLERCSFLRCSLLPRTMLPCSVECQVCVCACVCGCQDLAAKPSSSAGGTGACRFFATYIFSQPLLACRWRATPALGTPERATAPFVAALSNMAEVLVFKKKQWRRLTRAANLQVELNILCRSCLSQNLS